MEIEFHPDAVSEIREATLYYQAQQVGLGERFLSTVQESLTRISNFPQLLPAMFDNAKFRVLLMPLSIACRSTTSK